MKKQTFTLNEQTYGLILETIAHIDHDGSLQVSIQDAKEKRSLAQNALYWGWLTSLSEDTGNTKTALHFDFAINHLLPIYLEEAKNAYQENWIGLYDSISEDGTPLQMQRLLNTISTTWATTEQFGEYLNQIEAYCHDAGLHLPANPNYTEAMQ